MTLELYLGGGGFLLLAAATLADWWLTGRNSQDIRKD